MKIKYAIDDYNDENVNVEKLAKYFLERYSSVNVRSFSKKSMKSNSFKYRITTYDDLMNAILENSKNGLISLINQTIDINDGGVSGVTR